MRQRTRKYNKYRNKKCTRKWRSETITFDSQAEGSRFDELVLMLETGHISDLQIQVPFELAPSVKIPRHKRRKPAMKYYADFCYIENGVYVIEDVKGKTTSVFALKEHLIHTVYADKFASGEWRWFVNFTDKKGER